jgi:hypothetical protein
MKIDFCITSGRLLRRFAALMNMDKPVRNMQTNFPLIVLNPRQTMSWHSMMAEASETAQFASTTLWNINPSNSAHNRTCKARATSTNLRHILDLHIWMVTSSCPMSDKRRHSQLWHNQSSIWIDPRKRSSGTLVNKGCRYGTPENLTSTGPQRRLQVQVTRPLSIGSGIGCPFD